MAILRLEHHHDGALFQTDPAQIIENTPVEHAPSGGRIAKKGEAAAMEKLGKIIRETNLFFFQAGGERNRVHFLQIFGAHVRREPSLRFLNFSQEPFALFERAADADSVEN